MASVMDDLLSTDPNRSYTEECALQVLRLPGTLTSDHSSSTLWYQSKTLLTLAASYPRLLASASEFDSAILDLLVTTGMCTDFRDTCMAAMLLVNPGKIMDVAAKEYRAYESACFSEPAPEHKLRWLDQETDAMKELSELCHKFYFGDDCAYDRMTAARKLVGMNFVYPYTKMRLLLHLVRAMMAASHNTHIFDKMKRIFLRILPMWDDLTPRLYSCAQVTLGLCGNVEPRLRTKLMASLLRELWTASSVGANDFHDNDENLLLLTPDLRSKNVYYYTPDITLVCNIRQKCLGVVHKRGPFPGYDASNERTNMLAYAAMESAAQIDYTEIPSVSTVKGDSKSLFKLAYVKVDGVPSAEDDGENYMDVDKLTSAPATVHGFAVWNKWQRKLEYSTGSTD